MKKKLLSVLLVAAMTVASLSGCSSKQDSAEKTYTIGIIQLVQHVALDAATQGFEDAVTAALGDKVTFDYQNASGDSANCATIANSFVSKNVDLIMANATAALQASAAATATIPILGTSVTEYGVALGLENFNGTVGGNVSGTSDLAPLSSQADVLHELFPDAKTVGLLYCSAEANSLYQVETIKTYLVALGYECEFYSFSDSNDLSAVATKAAADSDVIYVPTDNTVASNTELVDSVCRAANTPVIAGEEGICKGCGVATLSISYYDIGYATGEMAVKILTEGADISTMAIEYAPQYVKEYNAELAAYYNLTIPEDYVAIEAE